MEINAKTFVYVVVFLGASLLLSLGGIIFLAANEKKIPDVLAGTPIAVTTGLIGLLVKTPTQKPAGE